MITMKYTDLDPNDFDLYLNKKLLKSNQTIKSII